MHAFTVKLNSQNWRIFWKIIPKARGWYFFQQFVVSIDGERVRNRVGKQMVDTSLRSQFPKRLEQLRGNNRGVKRHEARELDDRKTTRSSEGEESVTYFFQRGEKLSSRRGGDDASDKIAGERNGKGSKRGEIIPTAMESAQLPMLKIEELAAGAGNRYRSSARNDTSFYVVVCIRAQR